MLLPLQITFRGIQESDALTALIRLKARKLERYYRHVNACRVVVEQPHRHRRSGEHLHVRIDLTVPGAELVIEREPAKHVRDEDAYAAVRDAFQSARRQLQDYIRRRRGFTKLHVGQPQGRIGQVLRSR